MSAFNHIYELAELVYSPDMYRFSDDAREQHLLTRITVSDLVIIPL